MPAGIPAGIVFSTLSALFVDNLRPLSLLASNLLQGARHHQLRGHMSALSRSLLFVTVAAVVHKPGDIDKQKAKDNCQYAGLTHKNQPLSHCQDASADNERLTKTKNFSAFFML